MHTRGGMGQEQGASLVGVLVTLVILAALSVLAVAALPEDPSNPSDALQGATTGGDAAGGAATGAVPGGGGAPMAGVVAAACAATAQTVATAAATRHAADGAFPTTVAELVAGGWLASPPSLPGYDLTLEAPGGRPTGRILVNGLPAEEGCAAGPRPSP